MQIAQIRIFLEKYKISILYMCYTCDKQMCLSLKTEIEKDSLVKGISWPFFRSLVVEDTNVKIGLSLTILFKFNYFFEIPKFLAKIQNYSLKRKQWIALSVTWKFNLDFSWFLKQLKVN